MTLPARAVRRFSLAIAIGIALGFASSSMFAQAVQGRVPLNVKLGLWEMTTVVQMAGTPQIDTKGMTKEQVAQMQAMMSAVKENAQKPHTMRECLTKEKLDKGFFEEKDASCKQTLLESTSTTLGIRFECGGARPSSGEWHVVAVTPEQVKGTGKGTFEGTTGSMTSTAKWIGASCGNVK